MRAFLALAILVAGTSATAADAGRAASPPPFDPIAIAGVGHAAGVTSPSVALSSRAVSASDAWRGLVIDPGAVAYPRSVTVEGDPSGVSNPDGLRGPGGAATTLSSMGTTLLLDLGVNTGGTVEVGFSAGTGTPVHLAYAEAKRYMSAFGDNVEGSLGSNDGPPGQGRTDDFPAIAGTVATSPFTRGGERYIAVSLQGPGSATIDFVRVRVGHLRTTADAYTGHFLSSDPVLNKAWYASAYTFNAATDASSMVLMDGAKRDREAFIGDLTVGTLAGLLSAPRGPEVAKNTIQIFSCQQSADGYLPGNSDTTMSCPEDPPAPSPADNGTVRSGEYIAWYIVAAAEYLQRTGDTTYVKKLLPVLRRAAGYLRDNSANAWYSPQRPVEYGWMGGGSAAPATYTNTVVYRAYRTLAALERSLGGGESEATQWDAAAEATRKQIMTAWAPKTGAFRADRSPSTTNYPQDANVEAVTAGLIQGHDAKRALDYIRTHLWTKFGTKYADVPGAYISPYIGSYELEARMLSRDTTDALKLIRGEWGHMADSDPTSTTWEKVGLDGLPAPNQSNPGGAPTNRPEGEGYVSLAHAWSTGPVPALSEYVLGLRAVSPGYATWIVDPQPGGLRWAQGQVGTPHGPLVSRWERGAGNRSFKLTVSAPAGTSGTVVVPLPATRSTIARDGLIVWRDGRPTGDARATLDGGSVRFADVTDTHTYAAASDPAVSVCHSKRSVAFALPLHAVRVQLVVDGQRRTPRVRRGHVVVSFFGMPRRAVRVRIIASVGTRRYTRSTTIHPCTRGPRR